MTKHKSKSNRRGRVRARIHRPRNARGGFIAARVITVDEAVKALERRERA